MRETLESTLRTKDKHGDLISLSVESALERMPVAGVIARQPKRNNGEEARPGLGCPSG